MRKAITMIFERSVYDERAMRAFKFHLSKFSDGNRNGASAFGISEKRENEGSSTEQLKGYEDFQKKARSLLQKHGCEEKELSGMEKMKTYLMMNVQTMMDKSDSHIAQMMIQGSTMGITDAVKKLHDYSDAEKEIQTLMKDLQEFEEKSIEKLKEFL